MALRPLVPGINTPILEHLHRGTVEQFESEWALVAAGAKKEFLHDLGEIPRAIHVIESDDVDGTYPVDAGTDATVARADSTGARGSGVRTLTITNTLAVPKYFKVRAF